MTLGGVQLRTWKAASPVYVRVNREQVEKEDESSALSDYVRGFSDLTVIAKCELGR